MKRSEKSIKLKEETWKKLSKLKLKMGACSFDELIVAMYERYKKEGAELDELCRRFKV